MGTIKLYDPSSETNGTYYNVPTGSLAAESLILLNVLIELRVMTVYLAAMNPGIVADSIEQLRADVMAEGSS